MIHTLGNCEAIKTALGPRKFVQIVRSIERANKVNSVPSRDNVAVEPASTSHIDELVVCLPETRVLSSIRSLQSRITARSNILLCQDLPGVADSLKKLLPRGTPISYGVLADKLYVAGKSTLLNKLSPEYTVKYPYQDLQLMQLENLVVDSCIYSLARILDCAPREIPVPLMYNLIAESCAILQGYGEELINPRRMVALARERAETAQLRPEHMHLKHYWFLNGHLQKIAHEQGVKTVYNPMIMDLIKAKGLAAISN